MFSGETQVGSKMATLQKASSPPAGPLNVAAARRLQVAEGLVAVAAGAERVRRMLPNCSAN